MTPLLTIESLGVTYRGRGTERRAVDGVSFALEPGETVALVGASGSGKTATALSVLRLLPGNARVDAASRIRFEGTELFAASNEAVRAIRGRRIAMVFQEPATALNPRMRILDQVAEPALAHGERSATAARALAMTMLEQMGLADAARVARSYPHELSGGERQRVVIAMALLLHPALLVADEPTSALDVTVRAQILDLLRERQRATGMALLFVSHDLAVVASMCDRTLVMHDGRIDEDAPTRRLWTAQHSPYAADLVRAASGNVVARGEGGE